MAQTENKKDFWVELRKKFPEEVVGLLPKLNCYNCSQNNWKVCDKHEKTKCGQCGNWISNAHIHLDFVGHAAVTDRLNAVAGPENWDWEPLAVDESGLPKTDKNGNLWIKLMVRESEDKGWVSRKGYGDGSNSMKELIGDALRNAAMRFGIALDLWSKEELESTLDNPELKNEKPSQKAVEPVKKTQIVEKPTEEQIAKIKQLCKELGFEEGKTNARLASITSYAGAENAIKLLEERMKQPA